MPTLDITYDCSEFGYFATAPINPIFAYYYIPSENRYGYRNKTAILLLGNWDIKGGGFSSRTN